MPRGRKKGSKNKKKGEKFNMTPEPVIHHVEVTKPVSTEPHCLNCSHPESKHFGTELRNCNVMNCLCEAFKR